MFSIAFIPWAYEEAMTDGQAQKLWKVSDAWGFCKCDNDLKMIWLLLRGLFCNCHHHSLTSEKACFFLFMHLCFLSCILSVTFPIFVSNRNCKTNINSLCVWQLVKELVRTIWDSSDDLGGISFQVSHL